MSDWKKVLHIIKFDEQGLVSAIVLDNTTSEVLMLAHMNRESLSRTLDAGVMTYWSRSRQQFWIKGETSGNIQKVNSVQVDCDGDALLFRVTMEGLQAACHKGYRSCFFRTLGKGEWTLSQTRVFDPKEVYKDK